MSCGRLREDEPTGNVNDVWNVFLTIHRRDIGYCTPSDAIGISRDAYDADIRCRGKILDWIRLVSIPATYVCVFHTAQRAADGPPARVTKIDDHALFQRSVYLL